MAGVSGVSACSGLSVRLSRIMTDWPGRLFVSILITGAAADPFISRPGWEPLPSVLLSTCVSLSCHLNGKYHL